MKKKLTPKVIDNLCTAIGLGGTLEVACDYAEVSPASFFKWKKRAENHYSLMEELGMVDPAPDEEIYVHMLERVIKARGDFAVGSLGMIQQAAASGIWTAAAWKLERLYPASYGRHVTVQSHITGSLSAATGQEDGQRTDGTPTSHSDEEIIKIAQVLQDTGIAALLEAQQNEIGEGGGGQKAIEP